MEISDELITARNWCLKWLLENKVRVIVNEGIFYYPATHITWAELGMDTDPLHPDWEYWHILHETAHHMEGYSHRHQKAWGLDDEREVEDCGTLGDYNDHALYRETVVDAVCYLLREKFNLPHKQPVA